MKVSKLAPPLLMIANLILAGGTAQASVTFYDIFTNNEYSQTSNTQPSTAAAFFATATLSYTTGGCGQCASGYRRLDLAADACFRARQ
ncbi:MAG TPA: hypothetical protein VGG97_19345 [Bryobacteraceae bacterium]|jgi:hypothetical protein